MAALPDIWQLRALEMNNRLFEPLLDTNIKYLNDNGVKIWDAWADKYGDIGWQAVGIAPIRKTHSGLVPVSGDGNFEWEDYLEIIEKPNLFNPEKGYIATANQNVTPEDYERWDAIGYDWADPYRGERVNSILESKDTFNMEDMTNLQIDYFSIPSKQIINMSKDYITNNLEYFKKLIEWDNILDKNSISYQSLRKIPNCQKCFFGHF